MHGFMVRIPITWESGQPKMGRFDFYIENTLITYCIGKFNYTYPSNLKTIPYASDPYNTPVVITENENYSYLGIGHHLMVDANYPTAGQNVIVVNGSTAAGYTYGLKQGAFVEAASGWSSDYIELEYTMTSSNSARVKVNNLELIIPTLPTCAISEYGQFPTNSIKWGDMQPDIPIYGNLPRFFNLTVYNQACDDTIGSINIANYLSTNIIYEKKYFTIGDITFNCYNSISSGLHSSYWSAYKTLVNSSRTYSDAVHTLIRRAPYWYYTGAYSPFGPWYMQETDATTEGFLVGGRGFTATQFRTIELYWDLGISNIINRLDGSQMIYRTGRTASYDASGVLYSTRVWYRPSQNDPWEIESEWNRSSYNGIGYDYKMSPTYFATDSNYTNWSAYGYPYNTGSNGIYAGVGRQLGLLSTFQDGYQRYYAKGHRQIASNDLWVNEQNDNAGITGCLNVGNKTLSPASGGQYPESLLNAYGWEDSPFYGISTYQTKIQPNILSWYADERGWIPGGVAWYSAEQDGTDSVWFYSYNNHTYKIADTTSNNVYPWVRRKSDGSWRVQYYDDGKMLTYDSNNLVGSSWTKLDDVDLPDWKPVYYPNVVHLRNGDTIIIGPTMEEGFPIVCSINLWKVNCPGELSGGNLNMPIDWFSSAYLFERDDGQFEIGILRSGDVVIMYRSYDINAPFADWTLVEE